jgi:periplasmic protein TonB
MDPNADRRRRDGEARRPNGSARTHFGALAGAGGMTVSYDDPMAKVLELDASSSSAARWLVYVLSAIALLLGLMVGARVASILVAMTDRVRPAVASTQELDIVPDEPPPPAPPPPEAEAKPEPAPPPPRPIARETAPPTPPAQAGRVLTQAPDPNEPVDLTGNTIVSGNAESFAGGDTAANGTGRGPGHVAPAASGAAAAKAVPAPAAPAGPDRSRRASVGATEWNTPFPPESDQAQINDAYVSLEIDVRPDGTPSAVRVLKDPGSGFGREARQYALGRRYEAALDHDGSPIASTITLNVHFSR